MQPKLFLILSFLSLSLKFSTMTKNDLRGAKAVISLVVTIAVNDRFCLVLMSVILSKRMIKLFTCTASSAYDAIATSLRLIVGDRPLGKFGSSAPLNQ